MGKKYLIDETTLTDIADGLRETLNDLDAKHKPEDMRQKINDVYFKAKIEGYDEGEIDGFSDGYVFGKADGYDEGHTEGYEAGKQAEYNSSWDAITQDGKRLSYNYGFAEWGSEYIRPSIKIMPTNANRMFLRCLNLKALEKKYFDLSKNTEGLSAFCNNCPKLEIIEDINFNPYSNYYQSFSYCSNLHTIKRLPFEETTTTDSAFLRCGKLQNITIDGVIGGNISFSDSPLTVESMLSVITHLKDYSEDATNKGKYILTLKDTCKTLMAEQGAITELDGKTYDQYITDIGWNLA